MTPQENQALQAFLTQLVQTRGVAKDPQAQASIAQAAAQQPDAVYLLVLRCMQQDQALNALKAQVAQLQAEVQAARSAPAAAGAPGTFLDPNAGAPLGIPPTAPVFAPPPRQPAPAPAYAPAAPVYQQAAPAPVYQQAAPAYQQPVQQNTGLFGGKVGSFLGTVATTAAGVAAGAFLVEGIESLFGGNEGHAGHGGHGNDFADAAASAPAEQYITVNNYYGSDENAGGGDYQDAASGGDYSDADYSADSSDLSLDDTDYS